MLPVLRDGNRRADRLGGFRPPALFVLHEYTTLFTEDDHWFLLVQTKCRKLDENNRCTDYENRPNICREYTTARCEYEDHWVYDRYFETPEQIAEYAEAVLGPREGDDIRTKRGNGENITVT